MNIVYPVRVFTMRNVKARAVSDPDQFDVEINSSRGFSTPNKTRRKSVEVRRMKRDNTIMYDPDQYDHDANQRYSPPMDEASQLIDN